MQQAARVEHSCLWHATEEQGGTSRGWKSHSLQPGRRRKDCAPHRQGPDAGMERHLGGVHGHHASPRPDGGRPEMEEEAGPHHDCQTTVHRGIQRQHERCWQTRPAHLILPVHPEELQVDEQVSLLYWKLFRFTIYSMHVIEIIFLNTMLQVQYKIIQVISTFFFFFLFFFYRYVFYLIQIAIFNSFVLYQARNPQGAVKTLMGFIESLVRAWTTPNRTPRAPRQHPRSRLHANVAPLSTTHEPVTIPPAAGALKQNPTRRCVMCDQQGKRSETRFQCAACRMPLHRGVCFTDYHTQANIGVKGRRARLTWTLSLHARVGHWTRGGWRNKTSLFCMWWGKK